MNTWIFVIKGDESMFRKRIEQKKWPIFKDTNFRTCLEIHDDVIFYQAGKNTQKFLGTSSLKTKVKPILEQMDFYIELNEINIWKKQPSIRGLIPKLNFIKNKTHWGLNLQGGILKIDRIDYNKILREFKKMN